MRRRAPIVFLLSACFLAPFGCSEDPVTGPGPGQPGDPCEREDDCDDGNPCTFDFCVSGRCTANPATNGPQPDAEQIDGDCLVIACQNGESTVQPDESDPPGDPNDQDCMVPICNMDTPGEGFADPGEPCDVNGVAGVCDGMGTCSCAIAAGDPDAEAWVDPLNGSDMPTNGGRRGACAFQTLTYALTQHDGRIRLVAGEYSAATGETLPFVLTGNQRLRCYDFANDMRASLVGGGAYAGGTATVAFEGTQNDIRDCIVDGQASTSCLVIASSGVNNGHQIRDSTISGCDSGVTVADAGDDFAILGGDIQNNTTHGLHLSGATDKDGYLEGVTFSGNGTDVVCDSPSPELDGQGNALASCTGCMNCGTF